MGKYGLSAIIGDAYSTGPIASILSPFVLGMVVDRFCITKSAWRAASHRCRFVMDDPKLLYGRP